MHYFKIELRLLKKNSGISTANDSIPSLVLKDIQTRKGIKPLFLNTVIKPTRLIKVKNPTLTIELRDYEDQDQDIVSVYLNRSIALKDVALTKAAKSFQLSLNKDTYINELLLYAENLGTIPPNTALLTITDGRKKHKLVIESSMQKSAVIYLRRK